MKPPAPTSPTAAPSVVAGLPAGEEAAGKSRLPAAYWTPLGALQKWRKNPRKNDRAVPQVARSIRKYGFVAAVVVWQSRDRLVAGHTRIAALESILREDPTFVPRDAPGPGLVPVRFHEFTDEAEANAYAIADNKLGEVADWDEAALAEVMAEIQAADAALLAETGFDPGELARMLGDVGGDGSDGGTGGDPGDGRYQNQYGVIVMCADEAEQARVYEQLRGEGFDCKVVVT